MANFFHFITMYFLNVREGDNVYVFQMSKLVPFLKDSASKNVLPFHNVQALKYEVINNNNNNNTIKNREEKREREMYMHACSYVT